MILAREFRIFGKERIEEIKSKGSLTQSENFGVCKLKKENEEKPRFAFVISTKISKLAVHRNRINRSLHEGVRRVLNKVPTYNDYVFLAKKTLTNKTTDEIIKEVVQFFEKGKK